MKKCYILWHVLPSRVHVLPPSGNKTAVGITAHHVQCFFFYCSAGSGRALREEVTGGKVEARKGLPLASAQFLGDSGVAQQR